MIELLAPAGDKERLKFAFLYGADAVYFGGQNYSLRANAKNFSNDEIKDPFADDSEADDDEEIITGLIKMFSNEAHVSIPNYQYNHIKNSLLAMDQSDAIDLMYTVVNKVSQGEVQNPIGYLITSIASVKGGE